MIDIKRIKPKTKGESDKYSWNLYRFLHKIISNRDEGKYVKNQLEVHFVHNSWFDSKYLEFDKNKSLNPRQLIILPLGLKNGRSFHSVDSILTRNRSDRFALPNWELTDITDWFFETYERDGRCIFDRSHNGWMLGAKNRFTHVNNTRRCNWCGEWHHKEIKKKVNITRKEVWLPEESIK
ncbi:hypothetical protein [Paraliobacillus ryukyuensis]|uniref:hypothetical protein n=1 Tax=Paraliobacillus ryukyuensis TaxID=200904 RepID=UPI0009A7A1AD|nr:hypothetical protein [Paraliobacillus ryukyuensis]